MTEATGVYEADSPWHGKPTFQIKYDPDSARKLMTEAGFSAVKPLHVTVATSASGSGQMQPPPMNEYIQQSLKSCFFNVDIKVTEWNTLFTNWRLGQKILGEGDRCDQRQRRGQRSLLRPDPLLDRQSFPAGRHQLGLLSTPETENWRRR